MKKLFALALLGAAAAGTRLVADEGRIPISAPTTITKSGHYIVTRDLFINGPGSILAIGNNHVTIDLNGFSLQSLNGTDPVIRSLGGFGSLTIRNGTVEGGSAGILFPAGGTRVVIEGVLVTGADQDGIRLNGVNDFAIRRSIISIHHLDGIHVEAGNGYSEVVGTIGSYYSHTQKFCTTGGATTTTFPQPSASTYYLVVPKNTVSEGSYGRASNGSERPQGSAACLPQQIALACP